MNSGLTTCIKLGGSLFRSPEVLRSIVEILVPYAGRIILVNGSGPLEICYQFWREQELRFSPTQERLLRAQVRSTASMLLSGFHSDLVVVDTIVQAHNTSRKGKVPIADPLTLLYTLFDHRNGSGVLAAELCRIMHLKSLVIVTDVDGVKPNIESDEVFQRLSPQQLKSLGTTCLDSGIEDIIAATQIECIVLNGAYPTRLDHFLRTGKILQGTRIANY